jgi:AcrR family transcriptional regulator
MSHRVYDPRSSLALTMSITTPSDGATGGTSTGTGTGTGTGAIGADRPDRTPEENSESVPASATDGRQLRRQRNRDAVVEALLDLYRDGELQPSTEAIATRSGLSPRSLFRYFDDVNDLISAAVARQRDRALPLLSIDISTDNPLAARASALVDQRFRLFDAAGNAAKVTRLRSPFQPLLAAELAANRSFLRNQLKLLFAQELAAMEPAEAAAALATADVMASFEARHLLREDQGLSSDEAKAAMTSALVAILTRAG